jgi:hypothetical protein
MTHEYVIGLGGRIDSRTSGPAQTTRTAIGWAADRVLAVGTDDLVRAISRGDSTFLDLHGCVVTALPADLERADALVREATAGIDADLNVGALLLGAGLLGREATLEPGAPADLAFWGAGSASTIHVGAAHEPEGLRLVAVVRGGAFTEGDEHRGPFPRHDEAEG